MGNADVVTLLWGGLPTTVIRQGQPQYHSFSMLAHFICWPRRLRRDHRETRRMFRSQATGLT